MPCKPFKWLAPSGDVVSGLACSRKPAPRCQEPGCVDPTVALCDHPVTRGGKPGTCDRRMCERHRKVVPNEVDRDLCGVHARAPRSDG